MGRAAVRRRAGGTRRDVSERPRTPGRADDGAGAVAAAAWARGGRRGAAAGGGVAAAVESGRHLGTGRADRDRQLCGDGGAAGRECRRPGRGRRRCDERGDGPCPARRAAARRTARRAPRAAEALHPRYPRVRGQAGAAGRHRPPLPLDVERGAPDRPPDPGREPDRVRPLRGHPRSHTGRGAGHPPAVPQRDGARHPAPGAAGRGGDRAAEGPGRAADPGRLQGRSAPGRCCCRPPRRCAWQAGCCWCGAGGGR